MDVEGLFSFMPKILMAFIDLMIYNIIVYAKFCSQLVLYVKGVQISGCKQMEGILKRE